MPSRRFWRTVAEAHGALRPDVAHDRLDGRRAADAANYLTAPDANGRCDREVVKLSAFKGQKNVVLAFFPVAF